MLAAKVTDDFIIGGLIEDIEIFVEAMKRRFQVGKNVINKPFFFAGSEISQEHDGSITMSMMRYIERLKPIEMSATRRKNIK